MEIENPPLTQIVLPTDPGFASSLSFLKEIPIVEGDKQIHSMHIRKLSK